MYKLYWSRRTGAFAVDVALTESGAVFERIEVKRSNGRVDDPEFERLNPMKQIPALVLPSGAVITESAAMVMTVADSFPEARLLPETGTDLRAQAYRWLLHMVVNIYEPDLRYSYADRYTADSAGVAGVKTAAAGRWDWGFRAVEEGLGAGPSWYLGRDFSVLDPYLAMVVCWHYDTPALLARSPKIAAICKRVLARPGMPQLFQRYGMGDLD